MLYPDNTPTRVKLSLDGVWDFDLHRTSVPYSPDRPLENAIPMPVPSAYNDIYERADIRNHVGKAVYERTFDIPVQFTEKKILLRFGSVTHAAEVYLNGTPIGSHKGGFLPFAFDITPLVQPHGNRLTVLVDNIVDYTTLPCGTLRERTFPGQQTVLHDLPNFDYFNYCGIMRPVCLYIVPQTHIEDISVSAAADGTFHYEVAANAQANAVVQIRDGDHVLWAGAGLWGQGKLDGVQPWSPKTPKLYALHVLLTGTDGSIDEYTESFGFRDVKVCDCALHINGERIYLKGFGKHEDTPVLGRGFSETFNVKDLALMQWLHANSFRTSHYPYSEEMMRLCDRMGILVIDETPAVGMHTTFTATGMKVDVTSPTWSTLQTHQHHGDVIRELIARDKNHPCVILWSIANEPASEEAGAYDYFQPLFQAVRELDPQHRPVTFSAHGEATVETCEVSTLCDILMLNRYYGWYTEEGDLNAARSLLSDELDRYHARYPDKPIMLSEFGADAIAGLHDTIGTMFTEEFQRDMLQTYCSVLDEKPYICGEHVWNFADFATAESVKRVNGNKKGVFTRERKPKLAAWYLKERWSKSDRD